MHDLPGTTRDSVDTVVETDAGPIRFVDTAGMRRKSRIDEDTEYFSMVRALRSVDTADVALLVIDSTEGVTHQDQRLAERSTVRDARRHLLNKWELLDAERARRCGAPGASPAALPGRALSAQDLRAAGKGVHRLAPGAVGLDRRLHARACPTRAVNDVLRRAQQAQPAPHGGRVLYATQGATDPPTFTLFTNKELPASYLRYLERSIREGFDLGATPVKLSVRRRG